MTSRTLRQATTIGPAVIVALFGVITYFGVNAERRAGERVVRAIEVIDAYEAVLSNVRDAQNAQRGFVITGDNAHLAPYLRGRQQLDGHRSALRNIISGDSAQLADYALIDQLTTNAMNAYEEAIDARRTNGEQAALDVIATGRGELATQRLREIASRSVARERQKLERAETERVRRGTFIGLLVPLGTLLAIILGLLLNRKLARYARTEEQRGLDLRVANARLEEQQIELEMNTAEMEEMTDVLQNSEARFRGLIENAFDIVAVIDHRGQLTFVSPSVERILGFRPGIAIGHSPLDFVHPDDARSARKLLVAARRAPAHTLMGGARVRTKDGGWRGLTYTVVDLLDDSGVQGVVINARDVTESQRLEEQLLQSQKMEAIGRLAGGIAHDFNNLITTIKGHLTFAIEDLGGDHPVREDLETINSAADRAASLTKQLLAFSRRQVMAPDTLDMNEVVAEFERMIRRVIGEDIQIRTRVPQEPQHVRADGGQLQQVLLNLTVNARDAMPEGGTVTIEVRNETRDAPWPGDTEMAPGKYVMLAVSDTGTGMDRQTRDHIFEPFFTTKEAGKGTGLGLSMVYGIVKQSGGHIYVYSEHGQGTTFKIYLPQVERTVAPREEQPVTDIFDGTETILVVEDEPAVRSLAARALRARGYTVLEARNGREALEVLTSNGKVDLLLTDVIMPQMRGQQLAEIVTRERPEVKVILMSGYTDTDISALPNVARYIEKPFTIAALARKVREALDEA